ncbi:conserved hypothetical protein [Alteromonas macleodii]|uniref:Uncharacterized protein n=1 Tax=Alteromonas macleodii TaxID=28108 RepID=A0AB36FVX4_ALTMA|nr:hypothetical protein BFV95_1872 [Alteromonas macleodii]OES32969.1 hypothetical protein BFV94_1873 [Alteromonas macleodii]OES33005.1 hypothetical protein BFV93_1865 [Alteromonas macleodii]OES41487.1 hypothetical protein BFV96_1873 [Alteromonas macleodii]
MSHAHKNNDIVAALCHSAGNITVSSPNTYNRVNFFDKT